ncbi:uncharacterized protein si:ch211-237l4.6 [Cololabis saira]|uniref:uncharacterized protein si:ch211-237l4.6 n=1 Tax=Cololabis saira TaxID=129043 RepID=UPI002AD262B6|nr:uncharacterized protein si:ch211-237l4.6 [Cololabis saira]
MPQHYPPDLLHSPISTFNPPESSAMGVKMLQCFPFYRRCKDRCKSRECTPSTIPIEEMKPRLSSATSWSSDSEGAGGLSRGSQIYFSTKARLSFRHQLDSNINAVDATY